MDRQAQLFKPTALRVLKIQYMVTEQAMLCHCSCTLNDLGGEKNEITVAVGNITYKGNYSCFCCTQKTFRVKIKR